MPSRPLDWLGGPGFCLVRLPSRVPPLAVPWPLVMGRDSLKLYFFGRPSLGGGMNGEGCSKWLGSMLVGSPKGITWMLWSYTAYIRFAIDLEPPREATSLPSTLDLPLVCGLP